MNKPQESGYRIRGTFYPVVTSPRLTDPALVEQLTGLTFQEYVRRALAQAAEAAEEATATFEFDALVSVAAIGMAVARAHPGWSRTRVQDFLGGLDDDEWEYVVGSTDEDEEDADGRPPAQTETGSNPGLTSPAQSQSEDSNSNGSETQQTSGPLTSPMSPVER